MTPDAGKLFFLIIPWMLSNCSPMPGGDLAITNARIVDVRSGHVSAGRTILVTDGRIAGILEAGKSFRTKDTIDAGNKIVSPGLIDTHTHATDVLGNYEMAPYTLHPDSLGIYRKRISDQYLPFGTTSIMSMGQPEKWLLPMVEWQNSSDPRFVDLHLAGGAMISQDNRQPYIGHTEVTSTGAARDKILEYHHMGIRNVKLYYRLKEPEFSVVIRTADSLGMRVFGHISDYLPEYPRMGHALEKGLKNFEHMLTIPINLSCSEADRDSVNTRFSKHFGARDSHARVMEMYLETFRYVHERKKAALDSLIDEMARRKTTHSTTIHLLYRQFNPTWYTAPADTALSAVQRTRCEENFALMMNYLLAMHKKGISIRLGSDVPEGGKANLSEMILLCKYGFSVGEVFRIATLKGAMAGGFDQLVGTVEPGKKADLLIWNKDPFEDYTNFAAGVLVIKNGKLYE